MGIGIKAGRVTSRDKRQTVGPYWIVIMTETMTIAKNAVEVVNILGQWIASDVSRDVITLYRNKNLDYLANS